jgi:hypothetical protein
MYIWTPDQVRGDDVLMVRHSGGNRNPEGFLFVIPDSDPGSSVFLSSVIPVATGIQVLPGLKTSGPRIKSGVTTS